MCECVGEGEGGREGGRGMEGGGREGEGEGGCNFPAELVSENLPLKEKNNKLVPFVTPCFYQI